MESPGLDVRIKDSPFDPDAEGGPRVELRNADSNRPLYRVFLYLDGSDVPLVQDVTYHLHSTFPNPDRRVVRTSRNRRLKLEIWTWGIFEVTATATDLKGRTHRLGPHKLRYDESFDEPGTTFVERRRGGLHELGVVK